MSEDLKAQFAELVSAYNEFKASMPPRPERGRQ